jgi:hypothetical protein
MPCSAVTLDRLLNSVEELLVTKRLREKVHRANLQRLTACSTRSTPPSRAAWAWGYSSDMLRKQVVDEGLVTQPSPLGLPPVVASVTFGVYHAAHSAPFNTPGMIATLTAVGAVTSTVFLLLRDVYGTIVFHNCLAVYGVLETLVATGKVGEYGELRAPLLITALASLAILVIARILVLRDGARRRPTTDVP